MEANKIKRNKIWTLMYQGNDADEAAVRDIAETLTLPRRMAQILVNRGCHSAAQAKAFLELSEEKMHDPFLLCNVKEAVARIRLALERGERIAIYGDYDVDGVTSVSLLYLYLSAKGADVGYYIPSRIREGYGVSSQAIDMLADQRGVKLIITVDTGITAIEEVAYAKSRGVDMVITDHHECHAELPDACAVVNPHRPDCHYPFKELAGVGVVFKLLCAYEMTECAERGEPLIEGARRVCQEYADLVALGTIADVMPIVDENRIIVSYGLHMIANTCRKGLSALIDAALPSVRMRGGFPVELTREERIAQRKRRVNSGFVGFGLAPRINAAGRISTASKAVELLLAETDEEAERLARELCEINTRRQVEENRVAEQAYRMIEETADFENDRILVLDGDNWPQGIVGIVSSRVTERYGLPSILISFDTTAQDEPCSNDIGKGSGRSVKGLNLVEALMSCEDLLIRFGGHELAAGMSIARGNIERFRRRINEYARAVLGDEPPALQLMADCEIETGDMTMSLAKALETMEPFGVANPVPQFIVREMTVQYVTAMGGGKHTKLILSKDGASFTAVYFGISPLQLHIAENERVDVLFQLNINEFQNEQTLQMIVQDIRISETYAQDLAMQMERYEQIRTGDALREGEDVSVIPTREDFALVYTFLRREFRQGNDMFPERILLACLQKEAPGKINYIKLKFILRVLEELQICGVREPEKGFYIFDVYFSASKTSIDKSSILKKLRGQCRKK